MNHFKILILSFLISLFLSCQKKNKKAVLFEKVQIFKSPVGAHSALPFLVSSDNKLFLSWVENKGDTVFKLKYTEWDNNIWKEPREIFHGNDWFVNWADFPMLAVNKGNLWSHILKKSSVGTYSYDVKMNVLPEGAKEWKTDMPLHSDATPTEHGFVTALPYKDGFFVTWLDGRNTIESEVGERGAMTIRAAEVNSTGVVSNAVALDIKTCDCCQTTAVITDNGPVVFYRDRSDEEVRDISVVRQVNGEWTAPKPIYSDDWKIKGCPVNGPKAASIKNTIAVVWFTAAQENPRVQLVFSDTAGASFDAPIQIAEGNVLGRVDAILENENTAIVSWMETKNKQTMLKAVKVLRSGQISNPLVITNINGSRKSGFPQMELMNDAVFFAWTSISENANQVKMVKINLSDF